MTSDTDSAECGDEISQKAVESAARQARSTVTYQYITPYTGGEPNPAWPFPDGGFWGVFARSLEARHEQVREKTPTEAEQTDDSPQEGLNAFA